MLKLLRYLNLLYASERCDLLNSWRGFFRCQTAADTVTTEQLAELNYAPKKRQQILTFERRVLVF